MSSFLNLYSRLNYLVEAKASPMDKVLPGFQSRARSLATGRGSSSSTREGRLAMLSILFDLDIIDDSVIRMFKNDPSVSRMVDYFESNGISSQIKSRADEINEYIEGQLENKISFTTGNRTDEAQQRYEVNKLNKELKDAKKVARLERKKETAGAMAGMSQTVDSYEELIGSISSSYTDDYMLEIVADRDSDLSDINRIVDYLKKFVKEDNIEIEGRSIDVVFNKNTKLAKIIQKLGAEKVEKQISKDLGGSAGVVIHTPDKNGASQQATFDGEEDAEMFSRPAMMAPNMVDGEEDAESFAPKGTTQFRETESDPLLAQFIKDLSKAVGKPVEVTTNPNEATGPINEDTTYTGFYLSEQVIRNTQPVKTVSFKEKYAPKTAQQLAELRSYGL